MRSKDQILLEGIYESLKDWGELNDVESFNVTDFIRDGRGIVDLTFDDMVKSGYKFYFAYFYPLSHHEGVANVIFTRSKKKPTEEILDDFTMGSISIKPWEWHPLIDNKTFIKDIEKIVDKWNTHEGNAIEMDNPRVKGWGN